MSVSLLLLLAIGATCLLDIDSGLRATLIAFLALVVLPCTLISSVDAGRALRREIPEDRLPQRLVALLILPQAIFGIVLISAGLVLPFIGVRGLIIDAFNGTISVWSPVRIVIGAMMFPVGCFYLREGLGGMPKTTRRVRVGFLELNAPPIPRWLAVLAVSEGLTLIAQAVGFITLASITDAAHALWVWKSIITLALCALALPIAMRLTRASRRV